MRLRTPAQIGAVVRGVRHRQKLTQQQVADRAHVSRRWVSELENGKPRAELHRLLAVLEALGVGLSLVADDERPDPLDAGTAVDW